MALAILEYLSPACGFVGTVLIFFFGVPKQTDTGGKIFMVCEQEDEEEMKQIKRFKSLGNLGLACIALSFFLQLIILGIQ